MIPGATLPGTILTANLWWYAFTVLRPAQALKPLGLYRAPEIGRVPARSHEGGAGQHFCHRYSTPVLLENQPEGYASVEAFDHLSHEYDHVVEPFTRPIFEEVRQVMRSLATPRSRILDCSCGPGSETILLAALVPQGEVVGSDLAADMVCKASANAQQNLVTNTAFFQADVANMPDAFSDQFDFIYCAFAFHHYPDPAKSLQEMLRALRKGGHAFVVDAGPWWMKALASPLAKWGDPGWITFRTGEEFRELFANAGFSSFYWTEILPGIGLSIGTK
jgi:ubiquinone/menaquinone biosynthesis C-methylase UbiE